MLHKLSFKSQVDKAKNYERPTSQQLNQGISGAPKGLIDPASHMTVKLRDLIGLSNWLTNAYLKTCF